MTYFHVKKIIASFLFMASLAGVSMAAAVSILDHPTVAVPAFKNKGIISQQWEAQREDLNQAADFATESLVNSGKFDVVERTRLREITDEYALTNTGLVDQTTAASIGHLTGAQYLLIGSINSVTARKSTTSLAGAGTNRYKVSATVSVRMVDVETGRIVLASMGRATEKNVIIKGPFNIVRIGTAEVDEQQVSSAIQHAVEDAIDGPQGLIAHMEGRVKTKR